MSEVSKAAERLSKNGYSSTIELDAAGPTGFVIVNGSTWDDVTDLADWALPLLDSEPITEDWLRSVGFDDVHGCMAVKGNNENCLSYLKTTASFFVQGRGVEIRKARGSVRMLCLSLGIPLKQPAERP